MFRAPDRHQRSPGAPRPAGRFSSPASGWGFPRSPYGGSPRGYSPYSPGSNRGYRDRSPAGFGNGSRGFGESPAGFGSGSRGFGGPMRRRGDGFRRPQSLSPTSAPNFKEVVHLRTGGGFGEGGVTLTVISEQREADAFSDAPVQKYFSPSMMQDPWKNLQPVTTMEAAAARQIT